MCRGTLASLFSTACSSHVAKHERIWREALMQSMQIGPRSNCVDSSRTARQTEAWAHSGYLWPTKAKRPQRGRSLRMRW